MNRRAYIAGIVTVFFLFTAMLIAKDIGQATYVTLFTLLLLAFFAVLFSERVKGITMGKLVIQLYKESRRALLTDELIIEIGTILAKLSEHTNGGTNSRKEREVMISGLLKKAKASKKQREQILADAELMTRLMATEEGPELDEIRAEIDKRGLFD